MTIMKRKDYIRPTIELYVMAADDILDMAPQSKGRIYSDPPDDDDVTFDIDNSDTNSGWDFDDITL